MRRSALPVLAFAAASLLLAAGPSIAATDSTTLTVTAVNDRQIELTMTFDPAEGVTSESEAVGTVNINGTTLPATTVLNVEETPPTLAMLVLDSSGSMKGERLNAAVKAASTFIDSLPADVRVGLVTFSDQVAVLADPTNDRAAVIADLGRISAKGDTALYDALATALDSVPDGTTSRIVVLTDGRDTSSRSRQSEVIAKAIDTGTPIDVIAIRPTTEELESLRKVSGRTQGTLRAAKSSGDLTSAFATASQQFGATAVLTAEVPPELDASGQPVTANVTIEGQTLTAETTLPVLVSLKPVPDVKPTPTTSQTVAASSAATTPAPTAATVSPTARGALTAMETVLPFALAALVALLVVLIFTMVYQSRERAKAARRLEQVLHYEQGANHTSASLSRSLTEQDSWLAGLDTWLARFTFYKTTQAALAAGAIHMTPAAWLITRLAIIALLVILFGLIFGSLLWGLLLGILVGWIVTLLWLKSRANSRRKAFADELPDFLMLLASGLRAGLSFTHALESAAAEGGGEVGLQMRRAIGEVRVGAQLDDSLREVAERMDNDDLRWTVMALSIQREVGGNLSTILDTAAKTIKARAELRREVRTLSAEGKLSAYVLVALPLFVFAFLALFRREYISLLWTSAFGLAMLVVMVILMIVGWLWMSAITRIKV